MTETGTPEVVCGHRRLTPVVAEHEPRKQRAAVGGQGLGSPDQRAPHGIGGPRGKVAVAPGHDLLGVDPADHVATSGEGVAGGPRGDRALDVDRLAGGPGRESGSGRSSGPHLEVMAEAPDLGVDRPTHPLGVGHERDAGHERAGGHRLVAGPGPRSQGGGQQAGRRDQQQRPAHREGDDDEGERGPDRHAPRPPGPERRRDGQGHGRRIGEVPRHGPPPTGRPPHTLTRSRSCASLASPMPRT